MANITLVNSYSICTIQGNHTNECILLCEYNLCDVCVYEYEREHVCVHVNIENEK